MSNRPAQPWTNGQTYIERGVTYVYRSAVPGWRILTVTSDDLEVDAVRVNFAPFPAGSIAATNVQAAIEELATEGQAGLATHAARTDNPHATTKAQVGLANVDNTSDANKPISSATQTALDGKQAALGYTAENTANKGVASGYAGLDGSGKVPAAQLPSYVDDVLEFANLAGFPGTGETGKIYVALDTSKTYRWSGSAYVEISPSPGSTDAVPEGATNLYHTTSRAAAAAPVQSVAGRTGAVTLAKADVGLGNVDNTADASKSFVATQISNSTTVGRNVLTAADQAAARAAIGVGAGTGDLQAANNLSDVANAATARDNLSAVGTSRQVLAGGLATGGGDLTADRTITVPIASQAEAEAGTANDKAMTPLRVAQAVAIAVPAGAKMYFAMSTAPSGWLKQNGAAVSRTTYATLFAAIGTTYGAGDGSTTFNLPDGRGEFERGWDDGRGIDSGRAFGSAQTDAMQGHIHSVTAVRYNVGDPYTLSGGSGWNQGAINSGGPTSDGTNGTPRTAAETRPRNIAGLACIKY